METILIGLTDFIVARYSATNSGPPSDSLFHFQGHLVEDSCKGKVIPVLN
jgi:hypothetical protein